VKNIPKNDCFVSMWGSGVRDWGKSNFFSPVPSAHFTRYSSRKERKGTKHAKGRKGEGNNAAVTDT